MLRYLTIINTQFHELTTREFLRLLLKWAFSSEWVLVYKIDSYKVSIGDVNSIDGIIIKKGTLSDLEEARKRLKPCPWEFQCHIYDGVKDFFVAKDSAGIQHISWVYTNRLRNRVLRMRENEAEIKFSMTMPTHRGRGIYPRVITSIVYEFGKQNIDRFFICANHDNPPSIRGIEKAGFELAGKVLLRKFMGIQISQRFNTLEVL